MKKGDFHSPRSPHGEYSRNNPARRKDAIKRYKREWEKTERAKRIRRNNYIAKSNFLLNCKVQFGCRECEVDNPVILVFHHVIPKEKLFLVNAVCACRSWQSILNEISKCNVLCKNCHEIEHDGYWRGVIEEKEMKDEYPEIEEKQLQIDFKREEKIERINHLVKTMDKKRI